MGEVYGARDSRLDRDVAIKILPDAFAQDADRLARFDREARLLASLNHPHIAILHEIEAAGGVRYLVMELVPGETLAERIRRRPLSVEDALPLFQQLAGALEAAHDRGIIHRDLKPANIKVTPDSQVKVLDFGLATTLVAPGAPADASQSPTFICDVSGIGVGVVQGTAPYMSPEQARGLPVDRRTDIWAFGCVFFEALTGRPAFNGSTITDVLADVTKGEPDWTAIGEHVPARIRELLHRCLRKEKERRLQSIADARIEIEDAIAEIGAGERPAAPSRGIRLRPVYALVAVLLAFAFTAAGFWYMKPLPSAPSTRAAIEVPPGTLGTRSGLAFSPDGRSIVYGGDVAATKGLYFRDMGASKADLIPGTEGALHPFFAPDGRSIGFFAAGKIKRMAVPGGVPQDICDVQIDGYSSASWGTDDNIVFTQDRRSSLWRVSASGGAPQLLAEPDAARNERSYLFPESLPGGKAILYAARTDSGYTIGVFVPATGERRTVIEGGRDPHYASTGHMTFWQDFSIRAAPFDLSRLAVTGPAVTVIPDVSSFGGYGASYSLSASGHFAYFPAFEDKRVRTLVWVDRNGSATPLTESRQDGYVLPRLSPDGRRVLVRFEGTADCYLNTYDIARGSWNRLTYLGDSHAAVWSPDGARVAFQSDRAGGNSMLLIPVDGGTEETLYVSSPSPNFIQGRGGTSTCFRSPVSTSLRRFCIRDLPNANRCSRPTANGSRTRRTSRAGTKCTFVRSPVRARSMRSRSAAAIPRAGHGAGGSFFTETNGR